MSTTMSPRAAIAGAPVHKNEMLGHPKGLFVLFGVEMWERFSFYGMGAILALYLAQAMDHVNPGRGWTKGDAGVFVGWYRGMCYLTPVIGGMLADKTLGTHRSMLIGGLLIAMGHGVLFLSGLGSWAHDHAGMSVFVTGIALIVLGTGHFKPSVSVMVSQLYSEKDARRDSAFAIFYMGINVGAFLGQTCCGFGEKPMVGWHWGFGFAAIGMLAGLLMYIFMRPAHLAGIGDAPRRDSPSGIAWGFMLLSMALAALFGFLYFNGTFAAFNQAVGAALSDPNYGQLLKTGFIAAVILLAAWFVVIQQPGERGPVACILIFTLFIAVFWMAFHQSDNSLTFFAKEKTDRMLFGWEIPASWFTNVNPATIVILSPFFAWFWAWLGRNNHYISQPVKIALGLILLGFGYIFIVLGAKFANDTGQTVNMFWLMATYFWFTVGELFLSPTGLSFVTKAAPVRFVSLLMGIWFISSFIANTGGGYLAAMVEPIEKGEQPLFWYSWFRLGGQADYFLLICIAAIGSGLLILILTPLLNRMLGEKARM